MKKRLKNFAKRVWKTISLPEMRVLPGQLAFFFVMSIIPLIALIGTIASQFSISIDGLIITLGNALPKDVVNLLIPIFESKEVSVNLIIFYISAFLLASNGTHSMIITSNSIYKVENKNYLYTRLKALVMIIVLVVLLIFLLIVPAFGDLIVDIIASLIRPQALQNLIIELYQILKYPLSLFLIFFCIKLLYTMAPDKRIKGSDTTTGAIITTLGWIIATEIYSFYANRFASYNEFYGGISSILILMVWVYILAYIFTLGMALNATETEISEQEKREI